MKQRQDEEHLELRRRLISVFCHLYDEFPDLFRALCQVMLRNLILSHMDLLRIMRDPGRIEGARRKTRFRQDIPQVRAKGPLPVRSRHMDKAKFFLRVAGIAGKGPHPFQSHRGAAAFLHAEKGKRFLICADLLFLPHASPLSPVFMEILLKTGRRIRIRSIQLMGNMIRIFGSLAARTAGSGVPYRMERLIV